MPVPPGLRGDLSTRATVILFPPSLKKVMKPDLSHSSIPGYQKRRSVHIAGEKEYIKHLMSENTLDMGASRFDKMTLELVE